MQLDSGGAASRPAGLLSAPTRVEQVLGAETWRRRHALQPATSSTANLEMPPKRRGTQKPKVKHQTYYMPYMVSWAAAAEAPWQCLALPAWPRLFLPPP